MAEIAGVDPRDIKAWSQRSTRLREWARNNLVVVDGEPTAAQLAAAQKATRPTKPESLAWAELKTAVARRRARPAPGPRRTLRGAHRAPRTQAHRTRPARIAEMAAHIDKPASRAPTWSNSSARNCPSTRPPNRGALIEQIVDDVGVRISAPREPHHREGNEKFTLDAIIAEEERILDMVDDVRHPLPPGRAHRGPRRPVGRSGTSHPQHRGIALSGAAAASTRRCRQDALPQGITRGRTPSPQGRAGSRANR